MLILRSFYLGIIAAPFVLLAKLGYEIVWGIGASLVAIVIGLFSAIFPPLVILAIVPSLIAQCAILIGTLRPAVSLAQFPSEFKFNLMMQQIWKVFAIRFVLYLVLGVMLGILAVLMLGDNVLQLAKDMSSEQTAQIYVDQILNQMNAGEWPAIFTLVLVGLALISLCEAIIVVPMASAAYGAGIEGARVQVMSGFMHKFAQAFLALCLWEFLFGVLFIVGLALSTGLFTLDGVWHYLQSVLSGTAPDWKAHPLLNEVTDAAPSIWAIVGLMLIVRYVKASFWAATCATAFKSKMVKDGHHSFQDGPDDHTQPLVDDVDVRSLRHNRMPKRR